MITTASIERTANSQDNLAANVHIQRRGEEFNHDASNDDDGTQSRRNSTSSHVRDPTEEQKRNHTTNGISCTKEAKLGASRMTESILPAAENLHPIGHGSVEQKISQKS